MTTWLPASTVAQLEGLSTSHVIRHAALGEYGELKRSQIGRRRDVILIALESLPAGIRAKYLTPAVAPSPSKDGPIVASFAAASAEQRERAAVRQAAVLEWELFLGAWREGGGITEAKERWVEQYRLSHPGVGRLSVTSIERWNARYGAGGLDGLIDGNDGSARRGKISIPRAAALFFRARYLDKDAPPSIARAIEDTRMAAQRYGWTLPAADDPFYRYVEHTPEAMKLACRNAVDEPSKFLPYITREMDRPWRTAQGDHHIADVFVNCEGTVCGDAPCRAHRPWFTPTFDVGSRKVVSHQTGLEPPNSERILTTFRLAVELEGLPARYYVDNGKDFKKATGWQGLSSKDEEFLGHRFRTLGVEVVFARPYNAQAKAIERFFGTLVSRRWRGSEGYVGRLGKRSERTQHLVAHPELLPGFTEFCQFLDASIAIYNTEPHRGTGMRGRTPAEVFARERIPRREPDPFAFKLVFWRAEVRTLDRHGVRISNLNYTLIDPDASITARYLRERVKVLIDPDDVARAIVCNAGEQFLCEARVQELATHDSHDAVTQAAMDRVGKARKALLGEIHSVDALTRQRLRRFKDEYPQLLIAEASKRRDEEQQLVAAGGNPTTQLLPRYSSIARDAVSRREQLASLSGFAATGHPATAPISFVGEGDRRSEGRLYPVLHVAGSGESTETRARVEQERKRLHSLCTIDGCAEKQTRICETDFCGPHWLEVFGDELGPEVREHFRRLIEEEL